MVFDRCSYSQCLYELVWVWRNLGDVTLASACAGDCGNDFGLILPVVREVSQLGTPATVGPGNTDHVFVPLCPSGVGAALQSNSERSSGLMF